jgi:hypothetical protein
VREAAIEHDELVVRGDAYHLGVKGPVVSAARPKGCRVLGMEVVHEKPVTRVYHHRINERVFIPLVVSLMIGGFICSLLQNFARFEVSWFVRTEEREGKNGRPFTAFIVRGASGAESLLPTSMEPAGLQSGDLVVKSPGDFTFHRLPAGSPIPEPRWFPYGCGDVPRACGIVAFLALVVAAVVLSHWRRWVFDRGTGVVRLEVPMLPAVWIGLRTVPLADICGGALIPKRARTAGLWAVTMQTAGRTYEIAQTIYPDKALAALEALADVMPVKRLDSNA